MNRPKNETETHFMLKEISKYILWAWGYNRVATEVHNMYSYDLNQLNKNFKTIIDTVGIKKCSRFVLGQGTHYYFDIRGIEAKASLSDFKNGFCAAPALTYVIAPKNIIPIELIPEKIGLIEVDFDEFSLKKFSNKVDEIKGVNVAVRAKRRIDKRFKDKEAYKKWCAEMLETVAYRCSQELLFWRNVIEFG